MRRPVVCAPGSVAGVELLPFRERFVFEAKIQGVPEWRIAQRLGVPVDRVRRVFGNLRRLGFGFARTAPSRRASSSRRRPGFGRASRGGKVAANSGDPPRPRPLAPLGADAVVLSCGAVA